MNFRLFNSSIFYVSDFSGLSNFFSFFSNEEERWKMMREVAMLQIHAEGAEENVDPLKRISIESFTQIARMNISEILDADISLINLVPATRENLAEDILMSYRPFFKVLKLSNGQEKEMIAPFLATFIISTAVGNLSLTALDSYEVFAARAQNPKEALVCIGNAEKFIREWSLPDEDFWMWLCLSALSRHSIISIPHIHNEAFNLIQDFAGSYDSLSEDVVQRLSEEFSMEDMDFQNLKSMETQVMQIIFKEPEILLGAQISEVQESISLQLNTLIAVIGGLSQYILNQTVKRVFGESSKLIQINEAVMRKEAAPGWAVNLISRLLGIDMSAGLRELGQNFVSSIIERRDEKALAVLLESLEWLPTPAELEAPELWIARAGLED